MVPSGRNFQLRNCQKCEGGCGVVSKVSAIRGKSRPNRLDWVSVGNSFWLNSTFSTSFRFVKLIYTKIGIMPAAAVLSIANHFKNLILNYFKFDFIPLNVSVPNLA